MSLAMDYPDRIILLDDSLARRTAMAAGMKVWGTLKILLEAKSGGKRRNKQQPAVFGETGLLRSNHKNASVKFI